MYRVLVEIDDHDRGPDDGGKPFTATATTRDGRSVTVAAGLGAEPWEALSDLEVDWDELAEEH